MLTFIFQIKYDTNFSLYIIEMNVPIVRLSLLNKHQTNENVCIWMCSKYLFSIIHIYVSHHYVHSAL